MIAVLPSKPRIGALLRARTAVAQARDDASDAKIPFGGVVVGLAIMLPIYAVIALAIALFD